jgi:hypothetical protein
LLVFSAGRTAVITAFAVTAWRLSGSSQAGQLA